MNSKKENALPPQWSWATVEEVGEVVTGFTPPKSESRFFGGSIPLFKPTDLDSGYFVTDFRDSLTEEGARLGRLLPPLTVLVTCIGATIGKTGLTRVRSATNQQINAVVVDQGGVLPEWLYWVFNSSAVQKQIIDNASATTLPILNKSRFQKLRIPVAPREEQGRVVGEIEKQLSRLDASVEALKRGRANLKRYRASVLKAACEGRLVPTEAELARADGRDYERADVLLQRILKERRAKWEIEANPALSPGRSRGKYGEQPAPHTASLPGLPEGWVWATMPQLGELNRGKSKHRPRDDQKLFGGSYPFIQTGDVRRSGGFIREHSQSYNEFGLKQSRLWPADTLCITIAANIAETGFLTYPACFPDSVVGFSSNADLVTVRYIEKFLRTARQKLERFAPATAQKNINLETLSGVNVPLPPLAEQHRIVGELDRRLSVIEELEGSVEANLKRAERLRQSILKRAFEGQLLPQDPNDEPASILLERIRAERTARGERAESRQGGNKVKMKQSQWRVSKVAAADKNVS